MIQRISTFKLEDQITKTKNNETDYNYSKKINNYNKMEDTFTKSKNVSTVSFKGLLDIMANNGSQYRLLQTVGAYAKPEDKSALAYKIQLTPEIIEENMKSNWNHEKGILESYSLLDEEAGHVKQAFNSFLNIRNAYKADFASSIEKFVKVDPVGSSVLGLGAIAQFLSMASGNFWNKLDCMLSRGDIEDNSSSIKYRYWDDGVVKICDNYLKSSNFILQTVEKYHIGKKRASQLRSSIELGNKQIDANLTGILKVVKLEDAKMEKAYTRALGEQRARQFGRTAIKSVSFDIMESLPNILKDLTSSTIVDSLMNVDAVKYAKYGLSSLDSADAKALAKLIRHI